MATPMMTVPSWEPNLMPAASTDAHLSSDAPSVPGVRPFGMTNIEHVRDSEIPEIAGLVYDPARQVNVTSDGDAASGNDRILRAGTSEDTRYDNQWFVDKD